MSAKPLIATALAVSVLATSACSNLSQDAQRTLSGGAMGAAGGAAVGYLAGGSLLGGALIGGAAGAAIGALTSPSQVNVDARH
jgi:hypothetical protein